MFLYNHNYYKNSSCKVVLATLGKLQYKNLCFFDMIIFYLRIYTQNTQYLLRIFPQQFDEFHHRSIQYSVCDFHVEVLDDGIPILSQIILKSS